MSTTPAEPDRRAVREEMEQARHTFHRLLDNATVADLRKPSDGTKWTNQQLLFHMLFGYLIVRALLVLAGSSVGCQAPPAGRSRGSSTSRGPHSTWSTYWGSRLGARVIPASRMGPKSDRVIAALERSLEREPDSALRRGMHFPTSWDPFFTDYMTLYDIYRYPTRHFGFHRRQLTLPDPD